MKRFSFPLRRVLDWRLTQARVEETKLACLHAELRGIEDRIDHAHRERADSERALAQTGAATGAELAALDSFKKAVAVECARLESMAGATRRKIALQIEAAAAKRSASGKLGAPQACRLETRIRQRIGPAGRRSASSRTEAEGHRIAGKINAAGLAFTAGYRAATAREP